ncbi:MAG: GHMP kinase [Acidobacteria bacterium]|nr:MAG: GHMP kinase [Acidobacteriota bacterium]
MLIVRSPVRISFGGGGTDLPAYYQQYGGVVLSAAINKYFYTILGTRTDQSIQIISSDLRICEGWRDFAALEIKNSGLEIPVAVLKDLNREIYVDLFLASEIPPGTGLGSSASVCVNVLKTLTSYLHQPLSKQALAERAFHVARNVLGRHVGKQDEYAAAFGGLNFFEFPPGGDVRIQAINADPSVMNELQNSLMLFFTGSAHHSWNILAEQEQSTERGSGKPVEALHEIKELAFRMRDAMQRGDLIGFASMMNESWLAKKRVSSRISNSRIDALYEIAIRSGALGGKITGAGGGGFLLLFCEPQRQERVRQMLAAEGLKEMQFNFDFQGAQVLVNDPFIDNDEHSASRWTFVPMASKA